MYSPRSFLAVVLSLSVATCTVPPVLAAHPPIGILTLAIHAHLNEAVAFPGLSVFEGECLSTEVEGRLGIRAGRSTVALAGKTEVTLLMISSGMHIDLSTGSVSFSTAEKERIEVHAEEAMLRPESALPTEAVVTILAPKVLQITARKGGLDFSYREEFRNLPQGETYRIYLDAPAEPQGAEGVGAQKAGGATKVTYFIFGAGVAGAAGTASWFTYRALESGSAPISPAKP